MEGAAPGQDLVEKSSSALSCLAVISGLAQTVIHKYVDKSLVSIIIPAFNSSNYIVEAIESALQQTYSLIEVLVVDDGSTDDTREELSGYIESGRIRYQFQANQGLAAARNTGI